MHKRAIITICGGLGSGKSSTANKVAEALGFTRFSSGDFFRQVGIDLGIDVNELNIRAETDPQIDIMTDQKLRDLNTTGDKIVIDSRTAYHWIPNSYKVYLSLPQEIARHRIVHNLGENTLRKQSEVSSTPEEVYEKMQERFKSEQKRYWDLYQINNTDIANFDLIIDTNKNNLSEVVSLVVEGYKNWIADK